MRAYSFQLALPEVFEMFRARHGRVTSLTSALLRMMLTASFEGPVPGGDEIPTNQKRVGWGAPRADGLGLPALPRW